MTSSGSQGGKSSTFPSEVEQNFSAFLKKQRLGKLMTLLWKLKAVHMAFNTDFHGNGKIIPLPFLILTERKENCYFLWSD